MSTSKKPALYKFIVGIACDDGRQVSYEIAGLPATHRSDAVASAHSQALKDFGINEVRRYNLAVKAGQRAFKAYPFDCRAEPQLRTADIKRRSAA